MMDLSPLHAEFGHKPIAIVGLGTSGLPVFVACRAAGLPAVLWDDTPTARHAAIEQGGVIEDLRQADFHRFSALCLAPGIPLHFPAPHPCVLRAREAGIPILGDIELFHRALPSAATIGVTGTNGKSTTTALIAHLLNTAKHPAIACGNIGKAILSVSPLPANGTYVIEMSSYQLDLCLNFAPRIAVLSNLAPDHLDRHGGMDGYIAAKENIFRGPGIAIIGIDDVGSKNLYERIKDQGSRQVIAVSCLQPLASGISVTQKGMLCENGAPIIDLAALPYLPGTHNWQNAGLAYASCQAAGLSADQIKDGLSSFKGLAHRQNLVATWNGVSYVNDSKATNDQAAAMALRTYRPIYWIAGGRAKAGGYQDCEKYLHHVRHAWLIGEAQEILATWLDHHRIPYSKVGTLDKAVDAAHIAAQDEHLPGATVLLSPACASWDQFKNFEERGNVFMQRVQDCIRASSHMKGKVS